MCSYSKWSAMYGTVLVWVSIIFERFCMLSLKNRSRLTMAKMWVTWPNQLRIAVLTSLKSVANPLSQLLEKYNNTCHLIQETNLSLSRLFARKDYKLLLLFMCSSQLLTGSLASAISESPDVIQQQKSSVCSNSSLVQPLEKGGRDKIKLWYVQETLSFKSLGLAFLI